MLSRCKKTILLACLLLSGCGHSPADPESVRQQLGSAIPAHATQSQVLDYLDSQKIGHSPYRYDREKGNSIDAAILVKTAHTIVDPTYSVVFRFDKQDRLIDYDVQWLGYIPT